MLQINKYYPKKCPCLFSLPRIATALRKAYWLSCYSLIERHPFGILEKRFWRPRNSEKYTCGNHNLVYLVRGKNSDL